MTANEFLLNAINETGILISPTNFGTTIFETMGKMGAGEDSVSSKSFFRDKSTTYFSVVVKTLIFSFFLDNYQNRFTEFVFFGLTSNLWAKKEQKNSLPFAFNESV